MVNIMALITAVWVAGYVVQKSVSLAASFAWSAISSGKQGQEAYEERKRKLADAEAAAGATRVASETEQLRQQVRRLQAVVDRLEQERGCSAVAHLVVDQRSDAQRLIVSSSAREASVHPR